MTVLTNQANCGCIGGGLDPVVWTGVTNGSISISPTGNTGNSATWVLIATVPFGSGSSPLVDGMYGIVTMSYSAKSATPGYFSVARKKIIGSVIGNAIPASYLFYNSFPPGSTIGSAAPAEFELSAPDGLSPYVQIVTGCNASGDVEVYLVCKSTDGHSNPGVVWDFSDLSIDYQILGSV